MANILKSKKAILLEEVVNISIAVMAIAILVGLAVLVYSVFKNKHEIDQAQGQLDEIIAKINALSDKQPSFNHLYTNPQNWALVYYSIDYFNKNPEKNKIPEACKYKTCLCLCKDVKDDKYLIESVEACQKNKICANPNKDLILEMPLKLTTPPQTLTIKKINDKASIQ